MTSGYFSPESVAWEVHSDASAMVSGMRSLLVQALLPEAMAAVAAHGGFDIDFWGRLQRTSTYLLTVIYGSREETDQASAVVRAVHARIEGVDTFTGKAYRADDPDLLIWVHNATVESHLAGFQRYRRRLRHSEADSYVKDMRVLGQMMGVDEQSLPGSVAELKGYFRRIEPSLTVSPEARIATRRLLSPAGMPPAIRPLWTIPALAAVTSLPRTYQRLYGIPPTALVSPVVGLGAAALLTGFRALLPPPPIVEAAVARNR